MWVDKEPNIDTSSFKTYSWNTNKETKTESYYNQAEIDKQVRLEVDKSLQKLGYVYKETGKVDFFINYKIYIKENLFEQTICPTGFYGNFGYTPDLNPSPRCDVDLEIVDYDSGSLVFDIMDTRTGQLVCRGKIGNIIENPKYAPDIFSHRVHRLLRKIEAPM
jgi:hypothetical protein